MHRAIAAALLVLAGLPAILAAQTRTWDFQGGGQWQQVQASASQPAAEPTLDQVEQYLNARQSDRAKKLALEWFLAHRDSPSADRALFLMARAEDQGGDPILAFYYLDQLLDEHPESRMYSTAMQKQYEIADSYLRGRKRKLFGFPILGAEDEGVEMLFRIQQRSPGSPIAEKALLRSADFYFADRQYDLADDAYGVFIRQYPRSAMMAQARLKHAYSAYALFHGPLFEVTPIIDARQRLMAMINDYPKLAQEENIPAMLDSIEGAIARKLYLRADFYRRTHQPQAAAYTYQYLLKAYPDCKDAPEAAKRLAKLPESAKHFPEPKTQQDTAALRSTEPDPMPKMR